MNGWSRGMGPTDPPSEYVSQASVWVGRVLSSGVPNHSFPWTPQSEKISWDPAFADRISVDAGLLDMLAPLLGILLRETTVGWRAPAEAK